MHDFASTNGVSAGYTCTTRMRPGRPVEAETFDRFDTPSPMDRRGRPGAIARAARGNRSCGTMRVAFRVMHREGGTVEMAGRPLATG